MMESISSSSLISVSYGPCGNQKGVTRVATGGCPVDDDAVAALPDDWVPKHSGPTLANYLIQREKDHQNVHQEILQCATGVNGTIDAAVRTLAENLLSLINQNQLDMDCIIKKCGLKEEKVSKESRDDALKRISELYQQRLDQIATFKLEASALERKRADNLKVVLRGKFQRLVGVGHMTPRELLHDFDKRIYDINQQLLSNSRAFSELEARLRIQLDETMVISKSSLNQLTLGVKVIYREVTSRSALRQCKDDMQGRQQSAPQSQRLRDPSIGNSLLTDVEEIEACMNRLVQSYRSAVLKVFTGFCDKLTELEKDLYCNRDFRKLSIDTGKLAETFQQLIDRPLRRLSNLNKEMITNKSVLEITEMDLMNMKKSLSSLGQCLHDTFSVLHDSGHLWDAHILRTALAKKLTIAAVEDLLSSHDTLELANEIPISITMEQLRCAPDADKLKQAVDSINSMLDATAEMYYTHSQSELGRLEEFMNLPSHMANTLLSEFKVFLQRYPRNVAVSDEPTSPRTSTPKGNPAVLRLPLPRAILQTELQEVALQNWKNGFLESFEGNISLVPEELYRQAQLWVEERSTPLHMRYSLKMISHSIRKERVNAAAEVRLGEINYHEDRLQSHLEAVYCLMEQFPNEASNFAAIDAKFLYPIVAWLDRIKVSVNQIIESETIKPESKKLQLSSYRPRFSLMRQSFEDSLDKAIAEYKLHIEYRFQEVRISNVRFISNIKLFSEGGTYAAQEAFKASSALTKAAELLEICSQKTFEALSNRRAQLLSQADQLLIPVMKMLDEPVPRKIKSQLEYQKSKTLA